MSFATVLDAMILFEIKVQRKMGFCLFENWLQEIRVWWASNRLVMKCNVKTLGQVTASFPLGLEADNNGTILKCAFNGIKMGLAFSWYYFSFKCCDSALVGIVSDAMSLGEAATEYKDTGGTRSKQSFS
jgi:hypothetical protein